MVSKRTRAVRLWKRFLSVRKEVKYSFCIAISSIILQVLFRNVTAINNTFYYLGEIWIKICFSIVAATFFYFINQHLPKEDRKVKSIRYIKNKLVMLNVETKHLLESIGTEETLVSKVTPKMIIDCCKHIPPKSKVRNINEQVIEFENWQLYLQYKIDRLRSMYDDILILHDLLDSKLFEKVLDGVNAINLIGLQNKSVLKSDTIYDIANWAVMLVNSQKAIYKILDQYDDYTKEATESFIKDVP